MSQDLTLFLLSIRGELAAPNLEGARKTHNATAGAPANIKVAQALGDLSHKVHVPLHADGKGAGEFLILDVWNNLDGLNQFFANPTVQEQAGEIFSRRDPVVWIPAEGFVSYHLPAPFGANDRVVSVARGPLPGLDKAMKIHNSGSAGMINSARQAGNLSHEAWLRMAPPGAAQPPELIAIDVWVDHDRMSEYYDRPEFMQTLDGLFTTEPDFSVWTHPKGDWVEW